MQRSEGLWLIRQAIPRQLYLVLALAGLVVPLALWALLAASGHVDAVFMPGPATVLARVGSWWSEDNLLGDAGISILRVVAGWALAALVALPLGLFIGTFFQMVLMVAEDVRRVPMAQIEAAQTMGACRLEIVEQVIVPSAKPALLDTLRVTMGWAWTYLVVAELVAANSGLGFAILKAQRFLQTDKIFAGILLIGLIGLAIDQLFRLLHRRAFPWLHGRH